MDVVFGQLAVVIINHSRRRRRRCCAILKLIQQDNTFAYPQWHC